MTEGTPGAAPLRLVLVARCAELLAELRRSTPGIAGATLSTTDGMTVASTLGDKPGQDRQSAMSGSIAALASVLMRESGLGEPDSLILESGRGHLVTLRVPMPGAELVLTVTSDAGLVLGTLLWRARQTAERIAAVAAPLMASPSVPASAAAGPNGSLATPLPGAT